jgi:hypothetical protein
LFFTDSEFTSQEKLFVFSSCGGNGVAFVGFITKTAGNIDSIMLQGIPTKIPLLIHCLLIILVKKALLLTGILSCIFLLAALLSTLLAYSFICQYKSESSHDLHQFVNGLYNWTEFAFSKSKYCFNHCSSS